jgi:hypothetical protein
MNPKNYVLNMHQRQRILVNPFCSSNGASEKMNHFLPFACAKALAKAQREDKV